MSKYTFEVEFDAEVWASMSLEDRGRWVDEVNDVLSDHVYVSGVFYRAEGGNVPIRGL